MDKQSQLKLGNHQQQVVYLEEVQLNQRQLRLQEDYLVRLQQSLMQVNQQLEEHYLVEHSQLRLRMLEEHSEDLVPQLPHLVQQMLSHLQMTLKNSLIK